MRKRWKWAVVLVWLAAWLPAATAEAAFHLEYADEVDVEHPTIAVKPLVPTSTVRASVDRAVAEHDRQVAVRQAAAARRAASGGRVDWDCVMGKESYGGKPLPCAAHCSRLQWKPSTWRAAGGTKYAALPQHTSEANEIRVANNYIAGKSRDWILTQWPTARGCGL